MYTSNDNGVYIRPRPYLCYDDIILFLSLYELTTCDFVWLTVGGADVWPRGQTSFGNVAQPYHDLANLWRVWLPPEAEATFKKGKKNKTISRSLKTPLKLAAIFCKFFGQVSFSFLDDVHEDLSNRQCVCVCV